VDHYAVTLGVEYHTKIVRVDEHINIKMKIWDTAGQEAFNSIVKSFYRNSHVVLLVYDISRYS
jgi:Ras-related protein Rab-2A